MNFIKRIFGLLFLGFMLYMASILTLPKINIALSSINWETTEGEVLKNTLKNDAGKKKNSHQLIFEYTYTIDGKAYHQNSRFYDFDEPSQNFSAKSLKSFAKDYPIGSKINVHYNPKAPKEATIKKGILLQHWLLIFVNVFFILMSLHLLLFPKSWYWKTSW